MNLFDFFDMSPGQILIFFGGLTLVSYLDEREKIAAWQAQVQEEHDNGFGGSYDPDGNWYENGYCDTYGNLIRGYYDERGLLHQGFHDRNGEWFELGMFDENGTWLAYRRRRRHRSRR